MGLGLKGKILIGVMAACLVGGTAAGVAIAFTRTGANGSGNSGAYDKAVNLYWGHEQTTATIANVEDLAPSTPQYRGLTVSPQTSKSLAGNVQLTFTLAASAGNYHIKGLTISVYKIDAEFNAGTVETQISGKVAQPVLNESNLTGTTNLAVTTDPSAVHETVGYYAIAVEWSGLNDAEHPTYELDASVTISQTFIEA